ncbi:MAG: channel transporter [Microbacterium sp. SCN 70-27]|uniref:aquaporin n=1 Tax=unclassified Microbacterium TaxID=2609290 RepID=UPI00086CCE17|nr:MULTISPECIES: aquaporin [unclassified Microbacterium]MBN9224375.1 aquaporin [Microbacterium sp.]ODT27296.1 MAG: channel transporter [Microbacterium sp. SCN 70-27]
MTAQPLWRRALAEFLGTALLVAVVVGSGIAAQRLSADRGLQLLENSIATALGLGALILLLAPVSGAHFNPVVSLADAILYRSRGGASASDLAAYLPAQALGGIAAAILANAMFATPTTIATTDRATPATFLAEVVATAGLVLLIMGLARTRQNAPVVATAVGAYIGAAYWFTSSTSFANPAVTVGRIFSDTFAGIAPSSAPPFLAAQLLGSAIAIALTAVLFPRAGSLPRGEAIR